MPLKPNDLKLLKDKLLTEEKNTVKALASIAIRNNNAGNEYTAAYPKFGDAQDEDAQTSAVEEYSTRLSTERALEERLRSIRNALTGIEKNVYGKCGNCGKSISLERLKASPEAVLCGKCK